MKGKRGKRDGEKRSKRWGKKKFCVTVYSISTVITKEKVKATLVFQDFIHSISLLNNNDKYEREKGDAEGTLCFVYDEK